MASILASWKINTWFCPQLSKIRVIQLLKLNKKNSKKLFENFFIFKYKLLDELLDFLKMVWDKHRLELAEIADVVPSDFSWHEGWRDRREEIWSYPGGEITSVLKSTYNHT